MFNLEEIMVLSGPPFRWIKWIVVLLILKVTVFIVIGYRNYLPPDFRSDFLRGRESYFFVSYQWFFYVHLISGPAAILLGLLLVNRAFLRRFPVWHRRLGRIQAINVLCLLAPSGLWMAFYPSTGQIAGMSLGCLSVLTTVSLIMGWRRAVQRRFVEHRQWMLRNFTLLCSAVVLRIVAGTVTVFEIGPVWFDPLAAWVSWLVPLLLLELNFYRSRPAASRHLQQRRMQRRFRTAETVSQQGV